MNVFLAFEPRESFESSQDKTLVCDNFRLLADVSGGFAILSALNCLYNNKALISHG